MRASTKRVLSILTAILLIIASLVVYTYLIQPAYSEIINLRAEVASRRELVNEQEVSVKQVQNLLSEYQGIAQVQQVVSLILPTGENLPQSLNQITGLADLNKLSTASLTVQRLAIRPSAKSSLVQGVGVLRFNFQLEGSYENFKSFLQNLETNINLMDLASLKVGPSSKAKLDKNSFDYTMSVDTYYQAQ